MLNNFGPILLETKNGSLLICKQNYTLVLSLNKRKVPNATILKTIWLFENFPTMTCLQEFLITYSDFNKTRSFERSRTSVREYWKRVGVISMKLLITIWCSCASNEKRASGNCTTEKSSQVNTIVLLLWTPGSHGWAVNTTSPSIRSESSLYPVQTTFRRKNGVLKSHMSVMV